MATGHIASGQIQRQKNKYRLNPSTLPQGWERERTASQASQQHHEHHQAVPPGTVPIPIYRKPQ
jgi:hypothetical protein